MAIVDVSIDPLKLHEAWVEQAQLYINWAEAAADAQEEYELAKAAFEKVKADLDHDIRFDPAAYDLQSRTETAIAYKITVQPEYQAAEKKSIAARRKMNKARAAVETLEHRKRALTMLVELFVKEYYSETAMKRQVSQDLSEEEKRAIRSRGRQRRIERDQDSDVG